MFDQNADFVKKFVNIGDHIYIDGALSSTETQGEDGKKRNKVFIQCWRVGFEGFRNPNKDKNPSYSDTKQVAQSGGAWYEQQYK